MSQIAQTYVTSPRGKLRVWCGVFFLGLPFLLVLGWLLVPSAREWHVTGAARLMAVVSLLVVLFASIAAGLYLTFIESLVTIDSAEDSVLQIRRIWGTTLHRKVWRLSEFQRIEMRHRQYGEVPTDVFQTDVGIRHSSGFVVWLRGFWSSADGPSAEALTFVGALRESTGLRHDTQMA